MAEYPGFKHGTRAEIEANAFSTTENGESLQAIVYIGTAPVNQVEDGAKNVNKPILVRDISEARKYLGYSDNWAKYTLCEAMHAHMDLKGVGPLVFINVLNPDTHVATTNASESKTPSEGAFSLSNASLILVNSIEVATKVKDTDYTVTVDESTDTVIIAEKTSGSLGTSALTVTYVKKTTASVSLTPKNGRVTVTNAEDIILDSVVVTGKTKGTDYTLSYNSAKKTIEIVETASGSLGASALTITSLKVDPTKVTSADVIGSTDGYGLNTGIYAVKNVYSVTGYIPAFMLAPGFSSVPDVHNAMYQNSQKINGHWNCWLFVDMPIVDASTGNAITLATAPTWKSTNGYNKDNESVFFPMAKGTDGKKYHLSVLNAANFQELLIQNGGVPYMSGSNTACAIIEDLYFSESITGRVYDDEVINRCLNSNGINSAAYVSGRWAIWGMFAGSYSVPDATNVNVNDTCLMMLYYITNDFQHRRSGSIDQPMRINDLRTIVAEEQTRVDALVGIGALTYGLVVLDASTEARSDIYSGDFRILFNVTNTPLAKSITAIAKLVEDGYEVYFAALEAA